MFNIRLRSAMTAVLFLCFLIPVIIAGGVTLINQRETLRENLEREQQRVLDILAIGLQESIWTMYPEGGIPLVKAIMTDTRIVHVTIKMEDEIFLEERTGRGIPTNIQTRDRDIYYHGKKIGNVAVEMDIKHLREILVQQIQSYLTIILIPFILSMFVLYLLIQGKIILPLEKLNSQSQDLAQKKLSQPFVWKQQDEIGQVGMSLEKTRIALHNAFTDLEAMHANTLENAQRQVNINLRLQHEIAERQKAETRLRKHKEDLEHTVNKRTVELVTANTSLLQQIEERKKSEEERRKIVQKLHRAEKMEALGVLASGVAHDLNNILAGIVSYPDLVLLKLKKDSEVYPLIVDIRAAGKRAAAVVADLLTIARGSALILTPHDLNSLVRDYFRSPEFQRLENSYLHIEVDFQLNACPSGISCSPIHVNKCLMNLITNGFEACGSSGKLTVSTSNLPPAEGYRQAGPAGVVLEIHDSGPGITPDHLEHIFEPFYSTKQMGMSGSGLGLAIVWNTMEEHNGAVTVESGPDGTCFSLYFPEEVLDGQSRPEAKTTAYNHGNGEIILVVDDEELILNISRKMINQLGYQAITRPSGESAVDYLKDNSVDLVILDMVMDPGMNGTRTYEQILKIHPGQKAIVASGFAMNDDIRAALDLGVSTFMKKPYSMEKLAQSLSETLAA